MNHQHIIFDCDGVLVDSEPLSMQVDVALLRENGIAIGEDEAHRRFVGLTFAAMVAMMERQSGKKLPDDLEIEKDRRLLALYERELKPVPGIAAALGKLTLPRSLASNSPHDRVVAALRITGLAPWFETRITTYEHVAHGKPEPDIFIEAARRAGLSPARCLAVEDSVTGATAAARAGCTVLGFTGTHAHDPAHGGRLIAAGAAHVFAGMAELPALVAALG